MENLIDLSFDDNDNCPSIDNKDPSDFTAKTCEQDQNDYCDPFEFGKKDDCAKEVKANIGEQGVQVANMLKVEEGYLIDLNNDSSQSRNFCCKNSNMCSSASPDESNFNSPKLKNDSMEQKFVLMKQQKSAFQMSGNRTLSKDSSTHVGSAERSCSDSFAKASPQMIASESPLKLVDDDLFFSDNKFDADLEMLNIPMLQTLCAKPTSNKHTDYRTQVLKLSLANSATQTPESPCQTNMEDDQQFQQAAVLVTGKSYTLAKSTASLNNDKQPLEKSTEVIEKSVKDSQPSLVLNENQNSEERTGRVSTVNLAENILQPIVATPVSHINCASSKFQSHHNDLNNNERAHELLSELKKIIYDYVVNGEKRERASYLLNILQTFLPNASDFPPQSIVRQKTFDIEIEESPNQEEQTKPLPYPMDDEKIDNVFKQPHVLQNTHILKGSEMMQNGELNDIVNQAILSLKQTGRSDACNEVKTRNCDNNATTVIVVMNSLPAQTAANDASEANSLRHSLDKITHNPPSASLMRRRSMSLSLHDKLKKQANSALAKKTDANGASTVAKETSNVSDLKTPRRRSHSIHASTQKPILTTTTKTVSEKLTVVLNKHSNELKPKPLRNSLGDNSITSLAGSLKTTIPLKKVNATPSVPIDRSQARLNTSNTLFSRQSNLKPYSSALYRTPCEPSYPNACSTPTVKRHSALNQSTTSKVNATTSTKNSRQSLAKPKTPIKSRFNM